ncbi:MAG: PilZ domain-containing protein [Nitrospirota bacterium]
MDKRRHQRFIKRLTARFVIRNETFTGISSDISENGIFIRTTRGCPVNTPVDIMLLMPDNRVSVLKGIVRRTTRTPIASMKNGMGIEIMEKDTLFMNLVQSLNTASALSAAGTPPEPGMPMSPEAGDHSRKATDTERRRHRRVAVGHLQISGEIPNARKIDILNICPDGLSAKADMRLNIGNNYLLKIAYKEKELSVRASVIWSLIVDLRKDHTDNIVPVYSAGMQFNGVSVEQMQELIKLIEDQEEAGRSRSAMPFPHDEFIDLNEHFSELFEEFAR